MKAIQIKYMSATTTKGVRLKAFTGAGTIIESRDYSIDVDVQARRLADTYNRDIFWSTTEITGFGTLPNGDYVATI